MKHELLERIAQIREEISSSEGPAKAEAMEHLRAAVDALQASSAAVPLWVQRSLVAHDYDEVEDMFDNMPV